MKKVMWTTCLPIMLALISVTVGGSTSQAVAAVPVNILVNRPQATITLTPKFLGVCQNKTGQSCDDNQFRWRLTGNLLPGETLTIENAPNHLRCFNPASTYPNLNIVYEVTNSTTNPMPNITHDSGPPVAACIADDFGTYWPYVVRLTRPNDPPIVSDPGGIIHP